MARIFYYPREQDRVLLAYAGGAVSRARVVSISEPEKVYENTPDANAIKSHPAETQSSPVTIVVNRGTAT